MKLKSLALSAGLAMLAAMPVAHADTSFGTAYKFSWITPMEFVPTLSSSAGCELRYGSNFNFTFPAGCTYFDAPLQLPEGAYLSLYRVYFVDNSGTGDLTTYLNTVPGDTNTYSLGSSVSSSGQSTSVQSMYNSIDATVAPPSGDYQTIRLVVPSDATGISVRGVRLFWQRQISPAPLSASFTDVPTTHPFFKEVEALKASGVTAGCTATEYCPNSAVTRAQMAIFLARALGL